MLEPILIKGKPDSNVMRCFDCTHRRLNITWLCCSDGAIKHRKARLPTETNCKFWEPCRMLSELSWIEKTFYNYVKISYDN